MQRLLEIKAENEAIADRKCLYMRQRNVALVYESLRKNAVQSKRKKEL